MKRGLELPEGDLPRPTRTPRRAPDLAYEARLERLKAARNLLAQKYDLPPGVVCPNGTLEAIARVDPKTPEALAAVAELRRWQLREFGGELLGRNYSGRDGPRLARASSHSPATRSPDSCRKTSGSRASRSPVTWTISRALASRACARPTRPSR